MATQETIKQMFSGGVLRDVEDVTARQMVAALQNAIDALTSGDTTTAIENFQEVIDFLSGVTDDTTLIGKLNELRTLINAKYTKPTGGIPASDLASGVIPDVSGFATKTEVNTKANSADVYTKSQTDAAIEDALDDLPTGSVESVTVNGTKHTPDANGDVNLGTIQGEKGDKGDTGNVEITDAGDMVALIVNDLTTGGAGNFLSAEMGKRLKQNVDAVQANIVKLYSKLANMAFWDAEDKADAEPTPLDWSVPKVTVTITNNIGSDAVIKRNGVAVGNSLQVDQGDSLTLTIEPVGVATLDNVAATIDGVAATLTESSGIYTLSVGHVNAAMAIVIGGTATIPWLTADKTKMLDQYAINPSSGLCVWGSTAHVLYPTVPSVGNSVSPGSSPEFYLDVTDATRILFKFTNPNTGSATNIYYTLAASYFESDYTFISRDDYANANSESDYVASFNIPANTKYVKVQFIRKDGDTSVATSSYFSGLASDFLKYLAM